jgi:hypothetical protein
MIDPNRKTLRHFYCSDGLWQIFEHMSETMDRGVDDLVNDALRVFAEQGGYLAARMTSHYAGRPPSPPAPPMAVPPPLPGGGTAPPLYLIFGNQKYIVDKDQFIIGRGARTSDLPIRDGNISRKHAAVVRRAGSYYIKDLGSTNGIDFNGERIEARKIEEGDVYSICDYQLKFTYK